jgi:N-acetylglucosamine malate deacetylase 1
MQSAVGQYFKKLVYLFDRCLEEMGKSVFRWYADKIGCTVTVFRPESCTLPEQKRRNMKVDILAIGVHPDDVELSCSGTLLKHRAMGQSVAILDLTRGELGSRGTPEIRAQEAASASQVLGVEERMQVGLPDGMFGSTSDYWLKIVPYIRYFQPRVVLANAPKDRHPDHGRASQLVKEACFYSGLKQIASQWQGEAQEPWRPQSLFFYIQDDYLEPDFVVDITPWVDKKKEAILCFSTQFYNPESSEAETPISKKNFLDSIFGKNAVFGRSIGADFAEGFIHSRIPGVNSLMDLY